MHRAKGDRLVRASVLPVCDDGIFLSGLKDGIYHYILMVLFKSVTKIFTTILWKPELDPGFLERGFICMKGWGSFADFISFFLNIP